MIRVTLPVLVLIYVALLLASVLCAWLYYGWTRHRREREAFQKILRCTRCGFEFEAKSEEALPPCPRCGAVNERLQFSRL